MPTLTKEHADPFELPGMHRATFPLGLAITSAIIVGLGPVAAVANVSWGIDAYSDAVRFAWVYSTVALAVALTLAWPLTAFQGKPRRRAWDLAAIALSALPAMTLAAWMAVVPLLVVAKTLLVLVGVALWMQGMISLAGRSPRVQACIAGIAATLSLGVPAIAYLQEEFVGGSTAWSAISPLAAAAITATGASSAAPFWSAALYAILGAMLILLRAQQNPRQTKLA